jgi:hypothetical protein
MNDEEVLLLSWLRSTSVIGSRAGCSDPIAHLSRVDDLVMSASSSLAVLFPSFRQLGLNLQRLLKSDRNEIDELCNKSAMTPQQRMSLLTALQNYSTMEFSAPLTTDSCPLCFPRSSNPIANRSKPQTGGCQHPEGAVNESVNTEQIESEMAFKFCEVVVPAFRPASFCISTELPQWSSPALSHLILKKFWESSDMLRATMLDENQPVLSLAVTTSVLVNAFNATIAEVKKVEEFWKIFGNKLDHRSKAVKAVSHVSLAQVLNGLDADICAKETMFQEIFKGFTFSSPWYIIRHELDQKKSANNMFLKHLLDDREVLSFEDFCRSLFLDPPQLVLFLPLAFKFLSVTHCISGERNKQRKKYSAAGR